MNDTDWYDEEIAKNTPSIHMGGRSDLKQIYNSFFRDFRDHLIDFVHQSMAELTIAEMPVSKEPVQLFSDNLLGRYVTIKNQGELSCYITTGKMGGFRLDPSEKERVWLNKQVTAMTVSGNTTIGIIQT